MDSKKIAKSLLLGLLAAGAAHPAYADDSGMEKCYGIAEKGKNDCATAGPEKHACSKRATTSNNPHEWKYVPKGKCSEMGGKTAPTEPNPKK